MVGRSHATVHWTQCTRRRLQNNRTKVPRCMVEMQPDFQFQRRIYTYLAFTSFLFHFLLFGDALLGAFSKYCSVCKMSRKARKIAFQNARPLNLWGPSSTEKSEHSWIPPVCFQALSIHCSYFARASGGEVLWWTCLSVCVSVCASVSLPVRRLGE